MSALPKAAYSLIGFIFCASSAHAISTLPAYQADLSQTSVSGVSSGAFMSTQFHVAYSADIIGAGIIAGGPYYCAGSYPEGGFVQQSTTTCGNPAADKQPDGAKLFQQAQAFATQKLIDDPKNLQSDRVYLFSGKNDQTVTAPVVEQTAKFYAAAGLSEQQILYSHETDAGHALITNNPKDLACEKSSRPFVNNCGFIQSHDILKHIYPELNPPAKADALSGDIIRFNQGEFISGPRTGMLRDGYAYVPKACQNGGCRVHIVFHGCWQSSAIVGNKIYQGAGYNEIADSNKIIVLYPQIKPSRAAPYNPPGCWDYWGYSSLGTENPNFYTREAPQIQAVMRMIERLGEPLKAQ